MTKSQMLVATLLFSSFWGCEPSEESMIIEQGGLPSSDAKTKSAANVDDKRKIVTFFADAVPRHGHEADDVPLARCSLSVDPPWFDGTWLNAVGWVWCDSDATVTGEITIRRGDGSLVDQKSVTQFVGKIPTSWALRPTGCRKGVKYFDRMMVDRAYEIKDSIACP